MFAPPTGHSQLWVCRVDLSRTGLPEQNTRLTLANSVPPSFPWAVRLTQRSCRLGDPQSLVLEQLEVEMRPGQCTQPRPWTRAAGGPLAWCRGEARWPAREPAGVAPQSVRPVLRIAQSMAWLSVRLPTTSAGRHCISAFTDSEGSASSN